MKIGFWMKLPKRVVSVFFRKGKSLLWNRKNHKTQLKGNAWKCTKSTTLHVLLALKLPLENVPLEKWWLEDKFSFWNDPFSAHIVFCSGRLYIPLIYRNVFHFITHNKINKGVWFFFEVAALQAKEEVWWFGGAVAIFVRPNLGICRRLTPVDICGDTWWRCSEREREKCIFVVKKIVITNYE